MKIMQRLLCTLFLAVTLLGFANAEPKRQGSAVSALAQRGPIKPGELKAVVLPFWADKPHQVELARGAVMLNLVRLGFPLVPAAPSLPITAQQVSQAVANDPQKEPAARLQREDATRIGRKVKADWVVYGELEKLQTSRHTRIFSNRKIGAIDLRLVILDVASGEIIYWTRWQDTGSGGFSWSEKATTIERQLLTRTVNGMFEELRPTLSPLPAAEAVKEEDVQGFVTAMGQ
jgi:hypothetical protein